jgi:hypothetical protein
MPRRPFFSSTRRPILGQIEEVLSGAWCDATEKEGSLARCECPRPLWRFRLRFCLTEGDFCAAREASSRQCRHARQVLPRNVFPQLQRPTVVLRSRAIAQVFRQLPSHAVVLEACPAKKACRLPRKSACQESRVSTSPSPNPHSSVKLTKLTSAGLAHYRTTSLSSQDHLHL